MATFKKYNNSVYLVNVNDTYYMAEVKRSFTLTQLNNKIAKITQGIVDCEAQKIEVPDGISPEIEQLINEKNMEYDGTITSLTSDLSYYQEIKDFIDEWL